MNDPVDDLMSRLHREAVEQMRTIPLPAPETPTIHYSQLPDGPPNSPIADEWSYYRRIVGQLLAQGHEGKWLLIKNEGIIGIWNTRAEADAIRTQRFLMQSVLLKQILSREPILRIGYNRLCQT